MKNTTKMNALSTATKVYSSKRSDIVHAHSFGMISDETRDIKIENLKAALRKAYPAESLEMLKKIGL